MCVFLLEDLKRLGFLSVAKLHTLTKKRRYKLDKWQNKSDKNLANPPINKGFGKFVKRRGEKWTIN